MGFSEVILPKTKDYVFVKYVQRIMYCVFLQGLKTGMYYLRTKAAASAIKFTVDKTKMKANQPTAEEILQCSLENPEACVMCSG